VLRTHAGAEIRAESDDLTIAVGVELEHLDGITKIEMKNLIARQAVDDGEGVGREQVIDARREGARGVVDGRECGLWDLSFGSVGLAEIAAFDGERFEMEELAKFVGGEFWHE
jgi:hypothetical protein